MNAPPSGDFEYSHFDFQTDIGRGGPKNFSRKKLHTANRFKHVRSGFRPYTGQNEGNFISMLPLCKDIGGLDSHDIPECHHFHEQRNSGREIIPMGNVETGNKCSIEQKLIDNAPPGFNVEHDALESEERGQPVKNIQPFCGSKNKEVSSLVDSNVSTGSTAVFQATKDPHVFTQESTSRYPVTLLMKNNHFVERDVFVGRKRLYFQTLVYDPAGGEANVFMLCNQSLKHFEDDGKIIISYHVFFLSSHSGAMMANLAKKRINSQQRFQKRRGHIGTSQNVPNIDTVQHLTKSEEMGRIDWVINRVIKSPTGAVQDWTFVGNSKKPLSFLQSVGHVKLDLLPGLKDQIDSWFLGLEGNISSKFKNLKNVDVPVGTRSKIHVFLAKAYGQMVLGVLGTLVVMNHDPKYSDDEEKILKSCWFFIKAHLYEWWDLSSVEITDLCQDKVRERYSSQMVSSPKSIMKVIFHSEIQTAISSSCIWDLVKQSIKSGMLQKMEIPADSYFANKLQYIKENMESDHITGVSHMSICLHFLETELNKTRKQSLQRTLDPNHTASTASLVV